MGQMLSSSAYLPMLADHGLRIRRETTPEGRTTAVLVDSNNRTVSLKTPTGYYADPIYMPSPTVDDFLRSSFIQPIAGSTDPAVTIYELTADGRAAAAAHKKAAA